MQSFDKSKVHHNPNTTRYKELMIGVDEKAKAVRFNQFPHPVESFRDGTQEFKCCGAQ